MVTVLVLFIAFNIYDSNALSYGCFADGCNQGRTFTFGAAYIPWSNKQSLKINWTFSSKNDSLYSINTNLTNSSSLKTGQYLGCTTNVETGNSNAVSCMFKNRGLFVLDGNGEYLWSYQDPVVSSQIANISSVPLLLPYNTTIVDTGLEIMAFNDGVFLWEEIVANLSDPSNILGPSPFSAALVDPQYFSITLGDGRISLYDYSLGMCWASLYLMYQSIEYIPIAVTSSINTFIYVVGDNENINDIDDINGACGIWAFAIGDVTYRMQRRWVYPYTCNQKIGYLGISVIKYLDEIPALFQKSTLLFYAIDNQTRKLGIRSIRDESQFSFKYLWTRNVNEYCGMGYIIDPHDTNLGSSGVWICDYQRQESNNNTILLFKKLNITNGNIVTILNVNDIILDTFSILNEWKNILSTNISSRGASGFTSDLTHYVINICVNVLYTNNNNHVQDSNILLIIDIDNKYLLSWFIFENEEKCVGQLSATNDAKLIVPLSDGMTVIALSV